MRILFLGTPEFAVPSLKTLIGSSHEIVAVITQPDKPKGRKLQLAPPPVKEIALAHQFECLQPESLKEEGIQERVSKLAPDVCVVVAYGKIIPPWLLELPPHSCLNIHASLLPRYRGAAPIQRAIMNGEKETGVSIMLLDEGMDTGPVLRQKAVRIAVDDNAGTLYDKLAAVGAELLGEVLDKIQEGKITSVPQDDSFATYAPKIEKDEGRIDWSLSAERIHNLVRALNPAPGAFTSYGNLRVKIWITRVEDGFGKTTPGTILETKHSLVVATGIGALTLLRVQPENRDKMSGEEFVRGYRVKVGERLGQ